MGIWNSNGISVQSKMMDMLGDGMPHTAKELATCLHDDLAPVTNIYAHVTTLRKRLRPTGTDIVNQYMDGAYYYRLVRLVAR